MDSESSSSQHRPFLGRSQQPHRPQSRPPPNGRRQGGGRGSTTGGEPYYTRSRNRILRLKEFFKDHSNSDFVQSQDHAVDGAMKTEITDNPEPPPTTSTRSFTPFRGNSTFIPPKHRNSSIDTYCRLVERDISNLLSKKRQYKIRHNLTKTQHMELKALKNDESIIVQSADKGGALVIPDKGAYEQEIRRQLNDTAFYSKLDKNPVAEIKTRVHSCLQDLLEREEITRKEYDFMTVNSPVTPVFYTLSKIHKAYSVTPPGRPLVAAIGSLTEKVSAFVDYFLQPCVTSLPSYTKDSIDFIKTLQAQPTQDNNFMVTMDIESLYTNVPKQEGLRAAKHFLHQQDSDNSNTPSLVCLLELMETVLTNNYFMFGNDFYLQVSGVSMGSKMSPSFASLFVGLLEQEVILNPVVNPFLPHISAYERYIDDIWFIWNSTEESLKEFHHFMNTQHTHLKFTMSSDRLKMNFLDVLVLNNNGQLSTTLYRKPTDTNSLLHGHSYHPTSLKKGLPVSQFSRIHRLCSSDTDFSEKKMDLEHRFRLRGYKEEWITHASQKFSDSTQSELLNRTRTKGASVGIAPRKRETSVLGTCAEECEDKASRVHHSRALVPNTSPLQDVGYQTDPPQTVSVGTQSVASQKMVVISTHLYRATLREQSEKQREDENGQKREEDSKKCGTAQSGEWRGQSRELCEKTGEQRDQSGEQRGEEIGQNQVDREDRKKNRENRAENQEENRVHREENKESREDQHRHEEREHRQQNREEREEKKASRVDQHREEEREHRQQNREEEREEKKASRVDQHREEE
ncbi:hypothetical protein ABVT39_001599 [Epinephelus coioides]